MPHLVEDLSGEIWKSVNYFNNHHISNYKRVAAVSQEGDRISLLEIIDGKTKIKGKEIVVEYLHQQVFKTEIKEKEKQAKLEETRLKQSQFKKDLLYNPELLKKPEKKGWEFPKEQEELQNEVFNKIKDANAKENKLVNIEEKVIKEEKVKVITLTEEQKNRVYEFWDQSPIDSPPSIRDLTQKIFGPNFDGRSPESLAVKKVLAEKGLKTKTWREEKAERPKLVLTEEQKEFISNNCSTATPMEMARTLFSEVKNMGGFSQEFKIVKEYVESLPGVVQYKQEETKNIVSDKYLPPTTILQTIKRVNSYIANTGLEIETKLNPKEKKCMIALMGYLHNYRFLHQINTYEKITDRQLFEDAFIQHTWDAHDLQSQDVAQFLVLATEVVISHSILARMEMLKKLVDESVANDEDTRKFSMSLIEAINVAQTEYNSSVKRQRDLHDALTKKRSLRLGDQVKENASLVGLIQFWQNQEKRKQMIELAEMRKNTIKEEIERLRNMDELKIQIWGIHPEEILNS